MMVRNNAWAVFLLFCAGIALAVGGCAAKRPASDSMEDAPATRQMGKLILSDVPDIPEETVDRLRQYQSTRSAVLQGWVGDALLVATRFGESSQLHRVRKPMGNREQITFFNEPVYQAFIAPGNDDGFIYARDVGGSEFYQLYWFDWNDGGHRLLTDGRSRYGGVVWSNAGNRFAYYATERNGRSRDIHVQDLSGSVVVALEEDEGAWLPEHFSPDDRRLLVSRYVSINESYLYEVDLDTGRRRGLLEDGLRSSIGQARYSVDGRGVYFTSDMGAEFRRLHYLDLVTGEIDVLTADIPWNVEGFDIALDGSLLALSINEGGTSRVVVWRLPSHSPLALPELPSGVLRAMAFSSDSTRLALSVTTPTSPTDVWSVSIKERRLDRWTRSETGGLHPDSFVTPELVEFETFDDVAGKRRKVPAFLFRPTTPGPHPVLISIHGGPESQYRPRFSATVQYLVRELGLAVVAPNVRGSAGYGKSYLKLDNGLKREHAVSDIGALIDWIAHQEDLNADQIVVSGGSYGGYMVLASLVHYSDRLVAGIESVGISNFVTFLENTQPYRQDLRRAEYGDERDPEMRAHLTAISPLSNVTEITRPLMISQGANDPRVPASESEQIHAALKANGVPVWYVLAEDEGHGFRKKANRDYNNAVMSRFLEEFVLR